jgi:hypothetical protein
LERQFKNYYQFQLTSSPEDGFRMLILSNPLLRFRLVVSPGFGHAVWVSHLPRFRHSRYVIFQDLYSTFAVCHLLGLGTFREYEAAAGCRVVALLRWVTFSDKIRMSLCIFHLTFTVLYMYRNETHTYFLPCIPTGTVYSIPSRTDHLFNYQAAIMVGCSSSIEVRPGIYLMV